LRIEGLYYSSRREEHIRKGRYVDHGSIAASVSSSMIQSFTDYSPYQPNVTMDSCFFQDNSAPGVAIHVASGLVMISKCVFEHNHAWLGGALSTADIYSSDVPPPVVQVSSCSFVNNTAVDQGGAIYISNTNVTITDSSFEKNKAISGAAGYLDGSDRSQETSGKFYNCTFRDNVATYFSGVGSSIYALNAYLEMSDCIVEYGVADSPQVFLCSLRAVVNAANISVYGVSFMNMNGGAVLLEDVTIDSTTGVNIAGVH